MNVVITVPENAYTERMLQQVKTALQGHTLTTWKMGDKPPADHVDVLLSMSVVTRESMEALPGLALIQTLSDGYETVDVDAATELGIWVSYAPAEATGNGDSVAEYAVLLLLAAARRLGTARASLRDTSVERPDFVVLCIRATAENKHMFNAETFAAMKPGAVLVNIARGSLVDEKALFDAVESGHLGGAGLDVLDKEPADPGNPLLTLPQIFVTPHEAGLTDLTLEGTGQFVQQVINDFGAGCRFRSLLNAPAKPRRDLQGK